MLEANLRNAFHSMPDGMLLIDSQDRLLGWNPAYARLVPDVIPHIHPGMDFREALAIVARVRQRLDDPAAIEATVEARLARRLHPGVPFDSPRPNGGIMQIIEQRTPDGGWVLNYRDVTAERRASAALADAKAEAERAQALFRDGLESLYDGFMLLDAEDRLVTWNAAFVRFMVTGAAVARVGMTFAEYVRAAWEKRYVREPALDVEAAIRARLAAHEILGEPYEFETASGRLVQAIARRTSVGGKIVLFRDCTAERRALEAANAIAAEYRDGIESMLDAFAQYDAQKRLIRWNRRYETMFPHLEGRLYRGMPLAEILRTHARSPLYRIPPDQEEGWIAASIAAVWDAQSPNSVTRELGDGRTIWGLNTKAESGGMIFVIRDVTDLVFQEKQLAVALERERALSAQQRRFVAVAAHEFRTPLAIIDGAAQRLTRKPDGIPPEELRLRVERIRGGVARLAQLIDSTLNLERLESGQIGFSPQPLDLGLLLGAICRRLEGMSQGFTVVLLLPAQPVTIDGDATLLEQIVTNLVSNAIKYSGKSRRVEVALDTAQDRARISVRDFGIGIPENELGQIFDRYFRASTAHGLPGTGIGLELVRELVALHGGIVEVQSRVGAGSCFTVKLPLAAGIARPPFAETNDSHAAQA